MNVLKYLNKDVFKRGSLLGLQLLKAQFLKIPIAVNYDLTWQCNLRCNHCYFQSSVKELYGKIPGNNNELDDQKWLQIFKYHRKLGIRSAALTGGEPTLRMNLIQKAVEIFPSVQIASNGIIKLPIFKVKKQPIYWVSLDGNKETHNKIRGANIFDKVIDNIKNDKRVLISTTITKMNYKEIQEVVKIGYDIGVSGLFFLTYTGYPNDPLLLKGEILKKVTKSIYKLLREYGDFLLISKKMWELYINKEFVSSCIFKRDRVKCYYPNGRRKFCVMGNSPLLCENCGCIVPIASHAVTQYDSETIDKMSRFPF